MLELLYDVPAQGLELGQYRDDFQENFWGIDVSWKLERQDSFHEPDVASWVCMNKGDWNEALRLITRMRPSRAEHQRRLNEKGITQRRVRIVSEPVTSYLQWELHALRIWAELGEEVKVLPAEAIRELESTRELPEVVVLGGEAMARPVMYEIIYRDGVLAGARKFTDAKLIARCRTEIAELWNHGENLSTYFDREIAHLPPPSPQEV